MKTKVVIVDVTNHYCMMMFSACRFRLKEPYGPKPAFGVNLTLEKPGKIGVGDAIYAKKGQHKVSPF